MNELRFTAQQMINALEAVHEHFEPVTTMTGHRIWKAKNGQVITTSQEMVLNYMFNLKAREMFYECLFGPKRGDLTNDTPEVGSMPEKEPNDSPVI